MNFILKFSLWNILLQVWNYNITFLNIIDLSFPILESIVNSVLLLQTFLIKLFNLKFCIIGMNLKPEIYKMEVIQLISICSAVDIVTFYYVTSILCNDFILLLLLTFANGEGIRTINGHITIDIFTF